MPVSKPINESTIAALARSYTTLDYFDKLRMVLASTVNPPNLSEYSKQGLHWLINELLLEHYKGESILKAKLVDKFIENDVTAAFEIKVNSSRVDFLTVNGDSKSFEIKSELDNLQKLAKQIGDYEKVFDYNYIVIDEKHYTKALQLIPNRYGVFVLHGNIVHEDRPAELHTDHDPLMQLKLFTKKELLQTFRIPNTSIEEIDANFEAEEINEAFKKMLKRRYAKRWKFLVENKKSIYGIDYQFFFQHNIEPNVIYG
jgi:hypothetical protein